MKTGRKVMTAVVVQIKSYHYVLTTVLKVDMKEENGFENMWKTKNLQNMITGIWS